MSAAKEIQFKYIFLQGILGGGGSCGARFYRNRCSPTIRVGKSSNTCLQFRIPLIKHHAIIGNEFLTTPTFARSPDKKAAPNAILLKP
jgi:hypothetical protein